MKKKQTLKTLILIFLIACPGSAMFYYLFREQFHSLDVRFFNPLARTGLNPLLPDSYFCSDGCNNCGHDVNKFGLLYWENLGSGFLCTLKGCFPPRNNYDQLRLCRKDWKYSFNLRYKAFSYSANRCINVYRNRIYPNSLYFESIQAKIITKKQINTALAEAVYFCPRLDRTLRKHPGFEEKQLFQFYNYLSSYRFWGSDHFNTLAKKQNKIESIKEVFDFLKANPELTNKAIPENAIADFEQSYREYRQRIKQLEQPTN